MNNVTALKTVVHETAEAVAVQPAPVVAVALSGDGLRVRVREVMKRRQAKQTAVASEIGMSDGAVSSWFNGNYKGDIPALESRLRRWLDQQVAQQDAARAVPQVPAWVSTPSAKKVLAALRFVQSHGLIGLIYGGAGLGKTSTIRHYQSDALNVWVATMTPAHAGLVSALKGIAAAVGVEASGGAEPIYREIVHKVHKSRGLLVIDEAQHLEVKALEQIRSLNDETGVAVALIGNERVYARMHGGLQAVYLDRFRSRIGKQVRLQKVLPGDVKALAGAWGISGCDAALQAIAEKPGALRSVAMTLRLASEAASAQQRAVGAEDVRLAWGELGGVA